MKSTLFIAKEFGRYHFFKTAEKREEFIKSLTDWEQKFVESYEVGKVDEEK